MGGYVGMVQVHHAKERRSFLYTWLCTPDDLQESTYWDVAMTKRILYSILTADAESRKSIRSNSKAFHNYLRG